MSMNKLPFIFEIQDVEQHNNYKKLTKQRTK